MIAALFVEKDGAYYNLSNVDPWDEERDARKYNGPWPVVAHPPCSRWCRLAGLVEARWDGKTVGRGKKKRVASCKRGDDGGCFASALRSVRTWGGGARASGLFGRVRRVQYSTAASGWMAAHDRRRMGRACRAVALRPPGEKGDLALRVRRVRSAIACLGHHARQFADDRTRPGAGFVVRQQSEIRREAPTPGQQSGIRDPYSFPRPTHIDRRVGEAGGGA